jgi:signal transduction histidine kinase
MLSCRCQDSTHPSHRHALCENIASEPNGLCKMCHDLLSRKGDARVQPPQAFCVSEFIDDLAVSAIREAGRRDIMLRVVPAEHDAEILGDQQSLAAAIRNLLQNAIEFTRPRSTVTLRTAASVDRVLIEVQDERGGVHEDHNAESFHPFEPHGSDPTELGVDLAYTQWAVMVNGGRLYVRKQPGCGCACVVDLPRHLDQSAEINQALDGVHLRVSREPYH